MNRYHLGDAFDHWKGAVIERLRPILHKFRVRPMLTDDGQWRANKRLAYASFLRVQANEIIWNGETDNDSDLFLDPDIGIEPPSGANRRKHLTFDELTGFLPESNKNRLVFFYQHARRGVGFSTVTGQMNEMNLPWIGYNFGQVAMIFVSRKRQRIKEVGTIMDGWLGPVANDRRITPRKPMAGAIH